MYNRNMLVVDLIPPVLSVAHVSLNPDSYCHCSLC